MNKLPHHDSSKRHWNVRESGNRVRIVMSERWFDDGVLINRYVSVASNAGVGWSHVEGSASSHGDDLLAAEARVCSLLNGGWKEYLVAGVMKE